MLVIFERILRYAISIGKAMPAIRICLEPLSENNFSSVAVSLIGVEGKIPYEVFNLFFLA